MNPFRRPSVRYGRTPEPETPYQKAAQVWDERIGSARVQAKNWRLMAFGSLILSAGLSVRAWSGNRRAAPSRRGWCRSTSLGQAQAVAPAVADYRPTDPQIAWHLARFIEQVRAHSRRRRHRCARTGCAPTTLRPIAARSRSTTTPAPTIRLPKSARRQVADRGLQRHPRLAGQLSRRLDRARATRTASSPRPSAGPRSSPSSCNTPRDAERLRTESARHLRQRHQLVEGAWIMKPPFRKAGPPALDISSMHWFGHPRFRFS